MIESEEKYKLSKKQTEQFLAYINFFDTNNDLNYITKNINQYYLVIDSDYEIRIREIDYTYTLTIKSNIADSVDRNELNVCLPDEIIHKINFDKLPFINKKRIELFEHQTSSLLTLDTAITYNNKQDLIIKSFEDNIIEIEDIQFRNFEESLHFDLYFFIKNNYIDVTMNENYYNKNIFNSLHVYNQFDFYHLEVFKLIKDYLIIFTNERNYIPERIVNIINSL